MLFFTKWSLYIKLVATFFVAIKGVIYYEWSLIIEKVVIFASAKILCHLVLPFIYKGKIKKWWHSPYAHKKNAMFLTQKKP